MGWKSIRKREGKVEFKGNGEVDIMWFKRAEIGLLMLFLFAMTSRAQSTISGYVTGVVADPSKAAVTGAKVELENTDTSFRQTSVAGADGRFHFEYPPPGSYTLTITATEFTSWREPIVVTVGQSSTANAQLKIGSPGTTVEVSSQTAPIQAENGDVSTNYDETDIQFVPNPGQDITYINRYHSPPCAWQMLRLGHRGTRKASTMT
jgi:Carboxypeptidase regulatory-like domain